MADIPSIEDKITDTEVGFNQPVSEQLNTRYGGNVNNLIDENNAQQVTINSNTSRITAIEVSFVKITMTLITGTYRYTVPAGKFLKGGVAFSISTGPIVVSVEVENESGSGGAFSARSATFDNGDYTSLMFLAGPGDIVKVGGNAVASPIIYGHLIDA